MSKKKFNIAVPVGGEPFKEKEFIRTIQNIVEEVKKTDNSSLDLVIFIDYNDGDNRQKTINIIKNFEIQYPNVKFHSKINDTSYHGPDYSRAELKKYQVEVAKKENDDKPTILGFIDSDDFYRSGTLPAVAEVVDKDKNEEVGYIKINTDFCITINDNVYSFNPLEILANGNKAPMELKNVYNPEDTLLLTEESYKKEFNFLQEKAKFARTMAERSADQKTIEKFKDPAELDKKLLTMTNYSQTIFYPIYNKKELEEYENFVNTAYQINFTDSKSQRTVIRYLQNIPYFMGLGDWPNSLSPFDKKAVFLPDSFFEYVQYYNNSITNTKEDSIPKTEKRAIAFDNLVNVGVNSRKIKLNFDIAKQKLKELTETVIPSFTKNKFELKMLNDVFRNYSTAVSHFNMIEKIKRFSKQAENRGVSILEVIDEQKYSKSISNNDALTELKLAFKKSQEENISIKAAINELKTTREQGI